MEEVWGSNSDCTELIFGATAATGGRVKFLKSCVNFSEDNVNCLTVLSKHLKGRSVPRVDQGSELQKVSKKPSKNGSKKGSRKKGLKEILKKGLKKGLKKKSPLKRAQKMAQKSLFTQKRAQKSTALKKVARKVEFTQKSNSKK